MQRLLFTWLSFFVTTTIAITAAFKPTALYAVDSPTAREPMTIYITGSMLPAGDAQEYPATRVISKTDIEHINPIDVTQLLQSVGGLFIENASAGANLSAVYLRGAESNFATVMINGVKVNDSSNSRGGAFDFSLLNIDAIERIEIVNGPMSSLHGSDAIAGVINIITSAEFNEDYNQIQTQAGTKEFYRTGLSLGRVLENSTLSVHVTKHDDGKQIEGNQFNSNSLFANDNIKLNANLRLIIDTHYIDSQGETFPEASGGYEYAVIRELEIRDRSQRQISFNLQPTSDSLKQFSVQFAYFNTDEHINSPGVDTFIPQYTLANDFTRQSLRATYTLPPWHQITASIGLQAEEERGESDGVIDPQGFRASTNYSLQRTLYAVFTELRYMSLINIQVNAGLRLDVPDEFETEFSPRVGVVYTHDKSTLNIGYAEGFKLPGFFALGDPLVGNPDFIPETGKSVEAGWHYRFNNDLTGKLSWFDNRYYDLIDFDDVGKLEQHAQVTTRGYEIQIHYGDQSSFQLNANYTHLNMDIVDSDDVLHKRPEEKAVLSLVWRARPAYTLSFSALYVGKIMDFAYPSGTQSLDTYTRVDASIAIQRQKYLQFKLAVDNILDEKYQTSIGNNAPGLNARLSVNVNL